MIKITADHDWNLVTFVYWYYLPSQVRGQGHLHHKDLWASMESMSCSRTLEMGGWWRDFLPKCSTECEKKSHHPHYWWWFCLATKRTQKQDVFLVFFWLIFYVDNMINKGLMWPDIVRCLNVFPPNDTVRQCPCYKAEGESNWVQRRKKSLPLF